MNFDAGKLLEAAKSLSIAQWADLFSLLIAFFALIFSALALRVSSKGLSLARRNAALADARLNLDVHAANGTVVGGFVIVVVDLQVTNPSDKENSIKRLELKADFEISGRKSNLSHAAEVEWPVSFQRSGALLLSPGQSIAPRGSVVGVCCFKMAKNILIDAGNSPQQIIVLDAKENVFKVDLRIVQNTA